MRAPRLAALGVLACCLGSAPGPGTPRADAADTLSGPVPEPAEYWNGPISGPVPATIRGGKVIRVDELRAMLERERVVLVDVSNAQERPDSLPASSPWLPPPHAVIPGSLWIPSAGLGAIDPPVDAVFRERLAAATGNDPDRPVVIYCHERCWLSWNAAKRAIRYGYRNVHWLPSGIEGWRAAGLRTSTADAELPEGARPAG